MAHEMVRNHARAAHEGREVQLTVVETVVVSAVRCACHPPPFLPSFLASFRRPSRPRAAAAAASAVLLLPAVRPVLPCRLHGVSLEVDVRELTQSAIFSSKRETLPAVTILGCIKSTQNSNKAVHISSKLCK